MMDKVVIMNKAREKYRLEHYAIVRRKAEIYFEEYKNDPLFIVGTAGHSIKPIY